MQREPEIKIISLQKPQDPISRGYASAMELERHFTTITNGNFYLAHKNHKYPAYKFRGDDKKYFNIIEVLDTLPEDKMSELGKVLQDRYTVEKRKGNVNWGILYDEMRPMLYKDEPKASRITAMNGTPAAKKPAKKRTYTKRSDFWAKKAAEPTKEAKESVERILSGNTVTIPARNNHDNTNGWGKMSEQQVTAIVKDDEPTPKQSIKIAPAKIFVNMEIETADPELILEFALCYQKMIELKNRSMK